MEKKLYGKYYSPSWQWYPSIVAASHTFTVNLRGYTIKALLPAHNFLKPPNTEITPLSLAHLSAATREFGKNMFYIEEYYSPTGECKWFVVLFQYRSITKRACNPPNHSSDLEAAHYKQSFAACHWVAPLEQMEMECLREERTLFINLLCPHFHS